jgi:hypothetical protein
MATAPETGSTESSSTRSVEFARECRQSRGWPESPLAVKTESARGRGAAEAFEVLEAEAEAGVASDQTHVRAE